MLTQHRNKAFFGLGCWLVSLAGFILLLIEARHLQETSPHSSPTFSGILVLTGLLQFLVYWWGAYHLAKGRGQQEALILLGLFCVIGQVLALAVLMTLPDKFPRHSHRPLHKRRKHEHTSGLERVFRCRRNALIGIIAGVCGIMFGVSLVLWPGGFGTDPANIRVVGMFVFLFGYVGVISGCWWWLKAKNWNDAIIFIGLMPLGIFFVPVVRLIVIRNPGLLALGMVFMPFVLIVVVLALPDRSGVTKSSRRRNWF
jgi:hypothetical protein